MNPNEDRIAQAPLFRRYELEEAVSLWRTRFVCALIFAVGFGVALAVVMIAEKAK